MWYQALEMLSREILFDIHIDVTTESLYGYQIEFLSTAFLTPDTTDGLYGYPT